MPRMLARALSVAVAAVLGATGCASIPVDPKGTLERAALSDLMDSRPSAFDDRTEPYPARAGRPGAAREEGHVVHAEVFLLPDAGHTLGVDELDAVRDAVRRLDWKLHDVVIAPVARLPLGNLPPQ